MRMSRMFSKTLREAPNGADTKGYEYLLRAGYIRQMGAGIFSLLPLGFRATEKIKGIIRSEMEAIGAEEMEMPVVNPADIWKETGRYYSIDKEMSRFKDRNNRDMVLAMTHEEAVTDIARGEIDSYKRLPLLVYQMQTKWRDDPRPRAGLIRVREFTMLDSYSFDKDAAGLDKVYRDHYRAYFRIFSRCALPSIAVGADSGMMGGKISHEYMYLSPVGEQEIYPAFNGFVRTDGAVIYDMNFADSGFVARSGQEIYLYNGYNSSETYTAIQIVLEDGSLYNGYMLTADIEPQGISASLIVGITIIVAIVTIVLSLLFIKKKKKKKSGSEN